MKEALATIFLVAAIIAGVPIALAQTIHDPSMQGTSRHLAGAPSYSALLKSRSPHDDRGRRSPLEICQHQDPSTPALRIGTSECFSLPY
jgi:hypothetical protein